MSTDEPPEPNVIYKVSKHNIIGNRSTCDLILCFPSLYKVICNQYEWDVEYLAVVRLYIAHSPFQFLLYKNTYIAHGFHTHQQLYSFILIPGYTEV